MWYEKNKRGLDHSKPICCKNTVGEMLLLMPQIKVGGGYTPSGFNWFNTVTGEYQSSCFFDTAEEACRSYNSYGPVNCTVRCEI